MFQSFEVLSNPAQGKTNVAKLRAILKKRNLTGFLVPRGDEHMNEYVAPYAERLAWISGFTGSAGVAIILQNKAAIFVDGRYTLQVREQVDGNIFDYRQIPFDKPSDWIKESLKKGDRFAVDPKLHTQDTIERMTDHVKSVDAKLVTVNQNLIDLAWDEQPERPMAKVWAHPMKYAGETSESKIKRIRNEMKEDAVILTLTDSIAWTFNLRGADIPHTPLFLAYAIIPQKGKPQLFINPQKLSPALTKTLSKTIELKSPDEFEGALKSLGKTTVRLDDETASYWIAQTLKKASATLYAKSDPCIALKAVKNKAERDGTRTAHRRDGVAFCNFLHWLTTQDPITEICEITAAQKLENFRADTGKLKDISFDTISGSADHGAIIHYRVNTQSNKKFKRGSLYLVDSGAQYEDGTTDITRTIAIGKPTKEMRTRFTQVLKGHIALATARFPLKTRGQDLDPLVRAPLWQAGIDFDHGTGHGVGSFLSVHEGPQRIARTSDVELEPGMILSNEPGYYKEGGFGIRIENLIMVEEAADIPNGERKMMSFETLTLAPFDLSLIDTSRLTKTEITWINDYHATLYKALAPDLGKDVKSWLKTATGALQP